MTYKQYNVLKCQPFEMFNDNQSFDAYSLSINTQPIEESHWLYTNSNRIKIVLKVIFVGEAVLFHRASIILYSKDYFLLYDRC